MSREEKHCTFCNRSGHIAANCPRRPPAPANICGRCEHSDRENRTTFDTQPCVLNPFPFRQAKTYPAHHACDKGKFQPRRKAPTTRGNDHVSQPQLI